MIIKDIFQGVIDFTSFVEEYKRKHKKVNFIVYLGIIFTWGLALLLALPILCLDMLLLLISMINNNNTKNEFIRPIKRGRK